MVKSDGTPCTKSTDRCKVQCVYTSPIFLDKYILDYEGVLSVFSRDAVETNFNLTVNEDKFRLVMTSVGKNFDKPEIQADCFINKIKNITRWEPTTDGFTSTYDMSGKQIPFLGTYKFGCAFMHKYAVHDPDYDTSHMVMYPIYNNRIDAFLVNETVKVPYIPKQNGVLISLDRNGPEEVDFYKKFPDANGFIFRCDKASQVVINFNYAQASSMSVVYRQFTYAKPWVDPLEVVTPPPTLPPTTPCPTAEPCETCEVCKTCNESYQSVELAEQIFKDRMENIMSLTGIISAGIVGGVVLFILIVAGVVIYFRKS